VHETTKLFLRSNPGGDKLKIAALPESLPVAAGWFKLFMVRSAPSLPLVLVVQRRWMLMIWFPEV
jgi:hypothetical protein